VVAIALADAGATATTANGGDAAIQAWKSADFDVLLCDLAMPQTDGFAVLNRIRELNAGAGRRTVAVALTAYTATNSRKHEIL
jgi:CheY-like chemotaxis protein